DERPLLLVDQRLQALQPLVLHGFRHMAVHLGARCAGQIVGRSPWLQPVIVDDKAGGIGDIIDVRITKTGPNSLFAELA
ncbi:MAG: TRAM domain-containing protein, partial [Mesorhizobium sp.]